jgi:hypothetical protein
MELRTDPAGYVLTDSQFLMHSQDDVRFDYVFARTDMSSPWVFLMQAQRIGI